jgi:hypothetical protein
MHKERAKVMDPKVIGEDSRLAALWELKPSNTREKENIILDLCKRAISKVLQKQNKKMHVLPILLLKSPVYQ